MDERSRARAEPDGHADCMHSLLSVWLHPVDRYLRRRLAIFEYSQARDCIFRIEIVTNARDVLLVDGTRLRIGDRLIELHFWNEHVPVLPNDGATMAWGRLISRCLNTSMRELAVYLARRRDLDDVRGIRANMTAAATTQADRLVRIVERYGFEWIPASGRESVGQCLHRYGENILVSALIRTHNPRATQDGTLRRDRIPIYLSRRTLERYYESSSKVADIDVQSATAPKRHKIPRSKAGF